MRSPTRGGLSLFADLGRPQLESVAHTFSLESFPPGQRILRQGFQGTGFYVILDGEVAIRIDGEDRARLAKGDFFGEMSILLEEPPVADVVAHAPAPGAAPAGPGPAGFLQQHPHVMYRMLSLGRAAAAQRQPRTQLMDPRVRQNADRPFPPGDYPVVVVGSGPGGLQTSLLPGRHGHRPRGHLGRPVAGRHVPPLPVLPAAALVDQAARAVPAADPRVRVVRLEQPAGGRAATTGR